MTAPAPPASFGSEDLKAGGFEGWMTWDELRDVGLTSVPHAPAVYVVYRPATTTPSFLQVNPAGHFRGKDPTVVGWALEANWVPHAHVVFIGSTDVADRRLEEFASYGAGEPVAHPGGRYIWQLADSNELLVAWHEITWGESPGVYEKRLVAEFERLHGGAAPFANLTD